MTSTDYVRATTPDEQTPIGKSPDTANEGSLLLSASDRDGLTAEAKRLSALLDDARVVACEIQFRLSPTTRELTTSVVDGRLLIADGDIEPTIEGVLSGDVYVHVDPKTGRRMAFQRFDSIGKNPAVRWEQILFFNEDDIFVLESRTTDLLTIQVDPPRPGGPRGSRRRVGRIVCRRPRPDTTHPNTLETNNAPATVDAEPSTLPVRTNLEDVPPPDEVMPDGAG